MAIQKVRLTPSQVLTKDNIKNILYKARAGSDYCRIEMKVGRYITIAFFKDNTLDIMTNIWQLSLHNEIQTIRNTRSVTMLADYVFRWIQVYNR